MTTLLWIAAAVVLAIAATLAIPPLRRRLISDRVLAVYRRLMPPMSQTEREALEAGTVSFDRRAMCWTSGPVNVNRR